MQKFRISIAIMTIFLALSMTLPLLYPSVNAHEPAISIPTQVYIAISPNPVGVNQSTSIVFWNSHAPPEANSNSEIRWTYTVSVTDPNDITTSLGKFESNEEGLASTSFRPQSPGNWSVTVSFPETVYTWSDTTAQQLFTNDIFKASSKTVYFTVQNTAVPSPMPHEYASSSDNWFSITSNYLGANSPQITGSRYAKRLDNAAGSLTSHIMWTKPIETGGLVGGTNVGLPGDSFYSGGVYNLRFLSGTTTFILDGKLYYREPLGNSGASTGYIIVDLATGKEISRTAVTSSPGIGYSSNGITAFMSTSYGSWRDPTTLNTIANAPTLSNVPSGTTILGPSGEHLKLMLTTYGSGSSQILNLMQWNSSKVLYPGVPDTVNAGTPDKFDFNVTVTYNGASFIIPSTGRTIFGAKAEDYIVTATSTTSPLAGNVTFWMISLKPNNRGAIIANYTLNRDAEPFNKTSGELLWSTSVWDADAHVIPFWSKRTQQWYGFNFATGQAWGPTSPEDCWNYYAATDTATVNTDYNTMNGHLLSVSWAGVIYCYNISTGALEFTYGLSGTTPNANVTSAGYQAIYGHYPSFIGALTPVNNRIYISITEHSPNTPLLKGGYMRCFDVANQKEDWILPFFGFERPATPSDGTTLIVANGFTVNVNAHDQQIYALARGPSALTVSTVPQVTEGNKVFIKGTILDIAAGTNQSEQAARFPNGVACVSDDNMTSWMEYVYMHRPRPEVMGVNVTLFAVASDGATTEIGTVTSDDTGYFNYLWTAETAGTYNIIAKFDEIGRASCRERV
jgi:hypothetical protein